MACTDWISVTDRLPELGPWYWDENIAPSQGSRASKRVPVLINGDKQDWAVYAQDSDDNGATIAQSYWVDSSDESPANVTHWFDLPQLNISADMGSPWL